MCPRYPDVHGHTVCFRLLFICVFNLSSIPVQFFQNIFWTVFLIFITSALSQAFLFTSPLISSCFQVNFSASPVRSKSHSAIKRGPQTASERVPFCLFVYIPMCKVCPGDPVGLRRGLWSLNISKTALVILCTDRMKISDWERRGWDEGVYDST